MATESKQIDGVVDDPENGGLKSGPCLIAGFHALSCTSPSYYNPYRGVNKNTLSVDMVRLSLTFKGDRGEWLSRKGAQLTDCAIDPFLALVAAKEAHQIGARIYSATTTEYIRDV